MRLKTFSARDMQDAMQMAREMMGDEAVIISSKRDPKNDGVLVTVAMEPDEDFNDESPFAPIDHDVFENSEPTGGMGGYFGAQEEEEPLPVVDEEDDPLLADIGGILDFHGAPDYLKRAFFEAAEELQLMTGTGHMAAQAAFTQIANEIFAFSPFKFNQDGYRVMLVGPPGVGKTLALAKIAAHLVVDKQEVVLITTDNKRAGGVEQLSAFANIMGLDLRVATSRTELKQELSDCSKHARVLIDSAGCNPYDFQEMKELGEFAGIHDIEPILTCAAGIDTEEAEEIARVFSFLDIKRLIITRVDAARRLGSMLTLAYAGGYAFSHIGSTPKVLGDFRPLDAVGLGQLFMKHMRER